MKKPSKPKVGQIFSRLEYRYYNERMNQLDKHTYFKPKRLPRKLKKALKAKSKPTEYRIVSITKSSDLEMVTIHLRS